MATFTMYLHEVMELEHDTGNGMRIGLDQYPIFDESHREVLNRKIINRYYSREIGAETISMFKFALIRKLDEIMPYYNDLYLSQLIEFDPLATFNLKTMRDDTATQKSDSNSTTDTTSESDSKSKSMSSNTPQNELPEGWIEDVDYASSGAVSGSQSESTAGVKGASATTEESETQGTSTTTGFQGAAADLIQKYRAQIINVDVMILGAISDLFMGVWDNGQEMLPSTNLYLY